MAGIICAEAAVGLAWGGRDRICPRNRIKASPAERIAAQDAPQSECCAAKHSVVDDSAHGIFRARRLKTARAGDPADRVQQR
jgi:hypothetical protein